MSRCRAGVRTDREVSCCIPVSVGDRECDLRADEAPLLLRDRHRRRSIERAQLGVRIHDGVRHCEVARSVREQGSLVSSRVAGVRSHRQVGGRIPRGVDQVERDGACREAALRLIGDNRRHCRLRAETRVSVGDRVRHGQVLGSVTEQVLVHCRCRAGVRTDREVSGRIPRGVGESELDGARVEAACRVLDGSRRGCVLRAGPVDFLIPRLLVDDLALVDLGPGRARRVLGPVGVGVGVGLTTSGEVEDRLVCRAVVVRDLLGLDLLGVRTGAGVGLRPSRPRSPVGVAAGVGLHRCVVLNVDVRSSVGVQVDRPLGAGLRAADVLRRDAPRAPHGIDHGVGNGAPCVGVPSDPVTADGVAVDVGRSTVDETVRRLDVLVFDLAVGDGTGPEAVLGVRAALLALDHLGVLVLLVADLVVVNDIHHALGTRVGCCVGGCGRSRGDHCGQHQS